jgi:hypothetical protein
MLKKEAMKNWDLIQKLHHRGISVTKLARMIGSTHAQVSMTLNNTPGRGYRTRPKLAPLLTAEELKILGWDEKGTILHVELCST